MSVSDILKRENNNLYLISILLACLVIVGHTSILNGDSKYWVDPVGYFFDFTYSGSLAVKLFFFISGLVVTNSLLKRKSIIYFIVSRVFRILPALIFVLLITVLIIGPLLTKMPIENYFFNFKTLRYLLFNTLFITSYSLPGVFADNYYSGIVNGSLWSLAYEMGAYLTLLIFYILIRKLKYIYWNIFIIIILIDSVLTKRVIFGWIGDNPEISLLPASFALGVFYALNSDKIKVNIFFVAIMFLAFVIFRTTSLNHLFFIITCSYTVLYLSANINVLKFKPKYDIYLWGFIVQQTIYSLFGHLYAGFHCLLAIIFSIILALFTYKFIEKPFIEMGRKTSRKLSLMLQSNLIR